MPEPLAGEEDDGLHAAKNMGIESASEMPQGEKRDVKMAESTGGQIERVRCSDVPQDATVPTLEKSESTLLFRRWA